MDESSVSETTTLKSMTITKRFLALALLANLSLGPILAGGTVLAD